MVMQRISGLVFQGPNQIGTATLTIRGRDDFGIQNAPVWRLQDGNLNVPVEVRNAKPAE